MYEMYIAKVHWSSDEKPQAPTDVLFLLVLLFLSGACSYTLAVGYFYNPKNKFVGHSTRLLPKIDFKPEDHQQDIGPAGKDWLYMYGFMLLGTIDVAMMSTGDFYSNAFFSFYGIHDFVKQLSTTESIIDYVAIGLIYWGLVGSVLLCCVFYILCRDIVRHIEFTEELILNSARNFRSGRKYYECLLQYTEKLAASLTLWFAIHTLFFVLIVLVTAVDWITSLRSTDVNFKLTWYSQIAGSLLIAFKFTFPFLAASRVTTRFDNMYQILNKQLTHQDFPESDAFLTYCKRCEGSFKPLLLRITMNITIVSFASCFVGCFNFFKQFT